MRAEAIHYIVLEDSTGQATTSTSVSQARLFPYVPSTR